MTEQKETNTEEKKNELDILFPEEVVDVNGIEVIMRPLPLERLPGVMTDFKEILELMADNVPLKDNSKPGQMSTGKSLGIGVSLITQVVKVLPFCTFRRNKDGNLVPFKAENLPAKVAYDLVKVFLKQNVPEDLMGELIALTGVDPENLKKKNG